MWFNELTFKAEWTLLKEVLDKKYSIPDYQRDYSWKKKNIDDFLFDIFESSERWISHFIWSIVLFWKKTDDVLEVIDWQQRLITITLFLSSIKNILNSFLKSKIKDDEKKKIEPLLTRINYSLIRNSRTWEEQVIKINRPTNTFLLDIIEWTFKLTSSKNEENNMINNYKLINKKILEKLDNFKNINLKIKELDLYLDSIEWVSIIPIFVDNDVEAYTIFEVLNDRGLSLTVADLLKNLLFKKATWWDKEIIKKIWEQIQVRMEDNKIDISQFIRHYWLSEIWFIRQKDLYDELKEVIKWYTTEQVKDFWNKLLINSNYYRINYEPNLWDFNLLWWEWKKIFYTLTNIKKFRVKQLYPLLLWLYRQYINWNLNIENLHKVFKFLEHITFIFIRSDLSPSLIEGLYSEYSIKISKLEKYSDIKKVITELKNELKSKLKEVNLDMIFDNIVYDLERSSSNKMINYILQEIELNGLSEILLLDNTIEHIYPKDVGKNIENLWSQMINKIWNLTLLTDDDNNKLWNEDDFTKKKKIYKQSKLKITNWLAVHTNWWKLKIEERHLELKKDFIKIFSI